MKAAILTLAFLIDLCLSAPTVVGNRQRAVYPAEFLAVDRHMRTAREQPPFPQCDLSRASQPVAPTPLPSPDPSNVLLEVAIGRGVQNYTCSSSSVSATPGAIGAVASLFNASCLAANFPPILSFLPSLALQLPTPDPLGGPTAFQPLLPGNLDLSGYHYFITNTTPVFDLSSSQPELGVVVAKKVASSNAQVNATKGPNDIGDGAVPWLCLNATKSTVGPVKQVFRLNTAGGSPPKTCQGKPEEFSVPYAAEYWFYGSAIN